ncbi:hypothetical protein RGR602_PC01818 (plasmid) [Rhizobium gallicum bv. gallicum R602sp]|uniref:Uncharacterized protein n=1 Tax=Rhizobium gallicum bv. gallicum R602sp TaxID=1041138 RepID=A0A0B4XHA5_9HYPH|nr:hypothetical protein RGR602_PC01818 [Rhizobium gallicum bv. gallicum R602sp]
MGVLLPGEITFGTAVAALCRQRSAAYQWSAAGDRSILAAIAVVPLYRAALSTAFLSNAERGSDDLAIADVGGAPETLNRR